MRKALDESMATTVALASLRRGHVMVVYPVGMSSTIDPVWYCAQNNTYDRFPRDLAAMSSGVVATSYREGAAKCP
jgi:hypothetical protein